MIVNYCNNGERRIIINGNQVEYIYKVPGDIDGRYKETKEYRKDVFSSVNIFSISDYQILVGNKSSKKENSVISICRCKEICKVPEDTMIEYVISGGELFVKTISPEKQSIYDEEGNLIASETEYNIKVIFAGCGNVLQKTSKKDGKCRLYSFEGHLIG